MKIKLIKEKTVLSSNILQQVEDIINNVITIELKHLHQMEINILDKDEEPIIKYEKDEIDPDYLAVFINPLSLDSRGEIIISNAKETYPYIEIYPNRIKNALKIKTFASSDFKTIMAKIVIHELGHAYMFPANRTDLREDIALASEPFQAKCYEDRIWFKILEESLANWIAYNQNWDYSERQLIKKFITHQPIDYKHALTLIGANKSPFELADDWKMCKKSFAPIIKYVSCNSATELENQALKIINNQVDQAFNFECTGLEEDFKLYRIVKGNMNIFLKIKKLMNLGED
ncbi:MAG: hypothetical protein U9N52_09730 [Campylobacterota bacterium]|nr:hypothetical protein [Campylobacterota bacterium]